MANHNEVLLELGQNLDDIFIDGEGNHGDGPSVTQVKSSAIESEGSPAESPREARVRRAIEEAKKNFEPVREDDSWFLSQELMGILGAHISQSHQSLDDVWQDSDRVQLEAPALDHFLRTQLQTDKRASHKLDWSLTALYGNNCPRAALTLATAFLRNTTEWSTHLSTWYQAEASSGDISRWEIAGPGEAGHGKGQKAKSKEVQFSYAKEALDVALRSATKLLSSDPASADHDIARNLALRIASRVLPQLPHDGLREAIWDGSEERSDGWKSVHWTNTPGITLSMGNLCSQLGHWRAATLAYAMYIGLRGPVRIVSRCTAIALAQLAASTEANASSPSEARKACIILARAFAASYIGSTRPVQRAAAIQEVREGKLLPLEFLSPSYSSLEKGEGSKIDGEAVLRALLSCDLMHPESAIALVRCGPARNTAMDQCVRRLEHFLSGTDDVAIAAEDDDDGGVQIRSVRTL
ncbi:unnamed protein product [Tilletia controversa]|nr:unnamed protein product [Tilletia controversa]